MYRIPHMEHPVALDDHVRILEPRPAVRERPEVRLPPAQDDRYDVDSDGVFVHEGLVAVEIPVVQRSHVVALIGNVAVQ